MEEKIIYGLLVILVGILIKERHNEQGRSKLHERIDEVRDDFVHRNTCHEAMDGIKNVIAQSQKHIDDRFDDIKDLIKKNGHK